MSEKIICYDRILGMLFKLDRNAADAILKRLNQRLFEQGVMSVNQVYEVINQNLPEDQQVHPSTNGWGRDHGYASRIGDDDFEFVFTPVMRSDGTIWLDFECLPKEDSE